MSADRTTEKTQSGTGPVAGPGATTHAHPNRLSPEQFSQRLQEAQRTMWLVAASILNDPHAAHDMVQEASTIALGKLDDFDPATSFPAWISQIVRYASLNELRKRAKHRGRGGEDHVPEAASTRDISHASPSIIDERVSRALESLDETARACLVLRTVQGLSFAQISAALGVPEGTAMSHVFRARLALRDRLGLDPAPKARRTTSESAGAPQRKEGQA